MDRANRRPGPLLVEPESELNGAVMAEELRRITDRQDRLDADAETSDLPPALLGDAHAQDGVCAVGGDGVARVGAVEVRGGQHHVYLAELVISQLVGAVLHGLEDLAVAVAALGDPSLPVRVLLDQPGVCPVRLENALCLISDDLDDAASPDWHFPHHGTASLDRSVRRLTSRPDRSAGRRRI